ncbi:AtpZ/AtpI family protein [Natronoglycomyces albus]|uniref:AtpZ/AtpI family protein n=1 Tax=Natronoglycomyces albus TaxID=2811108 RepID=A0A895XRL2_9ACTN|nr:AtpZ/AtpI family protein [Natronoglycomyces albus]QSB06163.1 AtpZ/AtpI family protein [Natronoglycomyces albus]
MTENSSPNSSPPGGGGDLGYRALGYLLSGILFWGGLGYLLDSWLDWPGFGLLTGMLIGAAGGVYLVMRQMDSS